VKDRTRLGAFLAAFVFAGFALAEWFAGWYLQNEQGYDGANDGTRQLVLAALFGGGAVLCVLRGLFGWRPRQTGLGVAIVVAAQLGLCALATYLVDQSQKPGNETFLVFAGVPLLVLLWVACDGRLGRLAGYRLD
jgi:peptidoglycan/LPS O-acetylase OafA/YrhL